MTTTIRCDIVSAEAEIFHGEAKMIVATGEEGELGIMPRHCAADHPTQAGAGARVIAENGDEQFLLCFRRHPGSAAAGNHRADRHRDPRQGSRRGRRTPRQGPGRARTRRSYRCGRNRPGPGRTRPSHCAVAGNRPSAASGKRELPLRLLLRDIKTPALPFYRRFLFVQTACAANPRLPQMSDRAFIGKE